MATPSRILAWDIPWTEEPGGGYGPWGHKTVRHDLAAKERKTTWLRCPLVHC